MGLQSSIWSNRFKSLYLILLMPALVFIAIVLGVFLENKVLNTDILIQSLTYTWVSLPLIGLWLAIAIFFQKYIIFSFSWAKEITRKQNPEIYNIVENLCISRWLPIPKIWILEDDSLNAFATWWNPKDSWIVFSRGLLDKLDKSEIESVAAHELTHIINGDVKVMVISTIFIGIIGTIWEVLMRAWRWSKNSNGKWWNPLPIIGLFLYLLSLFILPLINLAISRKREFLADAGAVELTKDKYAMISALQKISVDSRIESISKFSVAQMCISNPLSKTGSFKEFFSTHPSIENRIKALQNY